MLYGSDSVFTTIGASLRGCAGIQVLIIDPLLTDALQRLEAARPEAVLYSLASNKPNFSVAVLRKHPGLLLIGLDLTLNPPHSARQNSNNQRKCDPRDMDKSSKRMNRNSRVVRNGCLGCGPSLHQRCT